jgi:hypothetical protein
MTKVVRLGAYALALAGLLLAGDASGAITIDGGPASAPIGGGGYTSGSGDIGTSGGLTWNYSNLDLSQSAHLYWGLSNQNLYSTQPTGLSLGNTTIEGNELFGATGFSIVSNAAVWTGSASLRYYHSGSLVYSNVQTRLTITVAGTGTWLADSTLNTGFAYTDALWEITGGTSFSANLLAEFLNPETSSWSPYITGWNSLSTVSGDQAAVSVTPGWYYESNPASNDTVPEPSTAIIWSLLSGLGVILSRNVWKPAPPKRWLSPSRPKHNLPGAST